MRTVQHVFVAAALACGAAFLTKIAAIAANEGEGSGLIGVLWTIGTVSFLVAAATGTALVLGRAPTWARWVAGVVAVPVGFLLFNLLDTVAKSVYRADGWFRDELSLVVLAVVMAALGLRTLGAVRHPQT